MQKPDKDRKLKLWQNTERQMDSEAPNKSRERRSPLPPILIQQLTSSPEGDEDGRRQRADGDGGRGKSVTPWNVRSCWRMHYSCVSLQDVAEDVTVALKCSSATQLLTRSVAGPSRMCACGGGGEAAGGGSLEAWKPPAELEVVQQSKGVSTILALVFNMKVYSSGRRERQPRVLVGNPASCSV